MSLFPEVLKSLRKRDDWFAYQSPKSQKVAALVTKLRFFIVTDLSITEES